MSDDRPEEVPILPANIPYRSAIIGVLLAASGLLALRVGSWQGWIRPVRVASGSMAGPWWGPNFLIRCRDCGFRFRCGIEFPPDDGQAVCPNCGYQKNPIDVGSPSAGRRVLIDRGALRWRKPRIWENVAFRQATTGRQWTVKRVIASGGQCVELLDGDVYVDGHLKKKSLEQLRQLRILVHDDRFRPSNDPLLPDRWRGRPPLTQWKKASWGYRFSAGQACQTDQLDWLRYHQWTCRANPTPPARRTALSPLLDDYAYNQGLSRGSLHTVHDIMLACRVRLGPAGQLAVRLTDQGDDFLLRLCPGTGRYQLVRNTRVVIDQRYRFRRSPLLLEVALCDHRLLAALNGLTLIEFSYVPKQSETADAALFFELAIGAGGMNVQLESPQVYRDIYYLGPGAEARWRRRDSVPADNWFVLGDNVPISLDSRHEMTVPQDNLIGAVRRGPW